MISQLLSQHMTLWISLFTFMPFSSIGIRITALEWFRSHLSKRTQFVNVNGASSSAVRCTQGLVLGPVLYSSCTSPLSYIASKHDLSFQFYANDTQLYVTFETSSLNDKELSNCRLEASVREIYSWMLLNRLKLNKDKTELLVISTVHRARPPLTCTHIHVYDNERGLASPKASNIGVLLDESLIMVPQVTAICKSAFYHLRKISLVNILPLMQPIFLFVTSLQGRSDDFSKGDHTVSK